MEMGSGCLCCSIRGDLIRTLRDVTWRFSRNGQRLFRRVLIETTGLADPAPIVHTLMTHPQVATRYRLDGIVATLDLATGANALDGHVEAVKQAAMADALLLTKADLATEEQRAAVSHRLDGINPAAPRWEARHGEIAPEKVLSLGLFSTEGKGPDVEKWLKEEAYAERPPYTRGLVHERGHGHHHHHEHHPHHDVNRHDDHIRAFCFSVDEPIPEVLLAAWLEVLMGFLGSKILRVKGILNVEGRDEPIVVHGVQHIFHPPVPLPAWPGQDRRSRLVFITEDVGRDVIEATFQAFRQVLPQRQVAASG
jgi:G3E family GTPase